MSGSERFGPTTIKCPYCLNDFDVPSGPTPRCTVTHPDCDGGRIIVDLEEGTAGKTVPYDTDTDH